MRVAPGCKLEDAIYMQYCHIRVGAPIRLGLQRNENQRGRRTVLYSGELAETRRKCRCVSNSPCWFTAVKSIRLQSKHCNFVFLTPGSPSFK